MAIHILDSIDDIDLTKLNEGDEVQVPRGRLFLSKGLLIPGEIYKIQDPPIELDMRLRGNTNIPSDFGAEREEAFRCKGCGEIAKFSNWHLHQNCLRKRGQKQTTDIF
jgi:hypothetical protein